MAIPKKFIAYFDILGFKNLVNNTPNLQQLINLLEDNYYKIRNLDFVKQCYDEGPGIKDFAGDYIKRHIHPVAFSDTILLVSNGNSIQDIATLLSTSNCLFFLALKAGFPTRGAIGYGQVYFKNNIIIGKGVINAYKWAEDQEWAGIVVTPECKTKINQFPLYLENVINSNFLVKYKVPLKKNKIRNQLTINWVKLFQNNKISLTRKEPMNKSNILDINEFNDLFLKNHMNYILNKKDKNKILNTYKFYIDMIK